MEYIVITTKEITKKCNDGWEPVGGIAMTNITNHQGETQQIIYAQALL